MSDLLRRVPAAVALVILLGGVPALAADPVVADPTPPVTFAAPPPKLQLDPSKGWYVSGKGGPSFSQLSGVSASGGGTASRDGSQNIVGAFGMAGGYEWTYRYHIPLRTELEFMNRTEVTYDASPMLHGVPSGALGSTVQNITTMAKAYWHVPVGSDQWWPFVSGGVGWSHNTVKSQYTPTGGGIGGSTSHASDDLAWSTGIGATFKLGPQVMNDVELRYVDLGGPKWGLPGGQSIGASGPGSFTATELSFAIRVMF